MKKRIKEIGKRCRLRLFIVIFLTTIFTLTACKKWVDYFTEPIRILFTIETEEVWTPTSDLLSICYINDKYVISPDYSDRDVKPISSKNGKMVFYSYLDTLRSIDLNTLQKRSLNIARFQKFSSNYDGTKLAYIQDFTNLFVLDVATGVSTLIYTGTLCGPLNDIEGWVEFSHNGDRLLSVVKIPGVYAYKLLITDSDGSNQILLPSGYGVEGEIKTPSFSYDDSFVYYVFNKKVYKCSTSEGTTELIEWQSDEFNATNMSPGNFKSAMYLDEADKLMLFYTQYYFLVDPNQAGDNADFSHIFIESYSFEYSANFDGKLVVCTNEFAKDRSETTGTKNLWVFPFSDDEEHTYRLLVVNQNCTKISFIPNSY